MADGPSLSSSDAKRARAVKSFQRLWVAGTLGAFFTALARNSPVDLRTLVYSFSLQFALATVLRYGYLLWLLWYFFLSNMRRQGDAPPAAHEVSYDVVQSIVGLVAAFYLDFLVPNEHHGIRGYIAANIAVFVICAVAFFWFKQDGKGLQIARGFGAAVAATSACAAFFIPSSSRGGVAVLLIPLAVLFWPIFKFHRMRLAGTI